METVVVTGTPRTELGKKATRALRKEGNVPCSLYGGSETLTFFAPVTAFKRLIYTPEFRLAEVQLNGKSYKAIVKDTQFDPVKDELLHVDLQELVDNVPVKVSVPLNLKGTAKGAAVGGKVEQVQRRLNILALPKDLVSGIELDITELDLGGILRISDLKTENIKYLLSGSNPVARMAVPRAAKEAAAAEGKKK